MKNYQILLRQIQGETVRQTWWGTREQHRGWGQSHVPQGGYRGLDGSHEEVGIVGTSGSARRRKTKAKYGVTVITAKSTLHHLTRNSERYLSGDVWTDFCKEKNTRKYPHRRPRMSHETHEPTTDSFKPQEQHIPEFLPIMAFTDFPVVYFNLKYYI